MNLLFNQEFLTTAVVGGFALYIGFRCYENGTKDEKHHNEYLKSTAALLWIAGAVLIIKALFLEISGDEISGQQPQIHKENHLEAPPVMGDESNAP